MNNNKVFNSLLNIILSVIVLSVFGGGFVLTLLFTSLGDDILTSWRFVASISSQLFISVVFLIRLLKNITILKNEKEAKKKAKLDIEITKRAAEIIKENEFEKL
jgi:hypothetical protein